MNYTDVRRFLNMDDFLYAESRVLESVQKLGGEEIGRRIRLQRERMGLSIRALAQSAHISKTSVVRLEAGLQCQPTTIIKICSGLGLHLDRLLEEKESDDATVVHRQEDDRWYDILQFADGPLNGLNRPLSEDERKKAAAERDLTLFLMYRTRLPNGRLYASLIELYHSVPPRSHPGEEFLFVLSGTAHITIASKLQILKEGECLNFWSEQEHTYAPAPDSELPVRLLCVQVSGS